MYVLYESQQGDARVSCFVNDSPYDQSYYQLRSRINAEHALPYAMAANAGVVKGCCKLLQNLARTRLSNDLEAVYR